MKLIIEVAFGHELSPRAQQDVKRHVQDFKEELEYLDGKVVRADLVAASPVKSTT